MGIPRADFGANWEWKVRRSATRARDGVTFMVHEALRCDVRRAGRCTALHRHEQWDARRRARSRRSCAGIACGGGRSNQLEELLLESGAASVRGSAPTTSSWRSPTRPDAIARYRGIAPHQPERRAAERDRRRSPTTAKPCPS